MGNARSLMVWLVVLSLQLAPRVTYADVGPGQEVRAIRHDLPIILEKSPYADGKPVLVNAVVVFGDRAVGEVSAGGHVAFYLLKRTYDRWWLENPVDHGGSKAPCSTGEDAPQQLAELATRAIPEFATPTPAPTEPPVSDYRVGTHYDCEPETRALLWGAPHFINGNSSYWFRFSWAISHGAGAPTFNLFGRAPTVGESWITPNNDGYAFFSATFASPHEVRADAGTMLDVWFPFVLDPSKTYSLTIAHVTPVIGPLNGTLKDNTLHFILPAFAVAPGAELMGEIDGD